MSDLSAGLVWYAEFYEGGWTNFGNRLECCDVASASWLSSDELRRVYSPVRIATSVLRIEITTGVYASVHSSMRGASNSAWASDEDNGSTWTYV